MTFPETPDKTAAGVPAPGSEPAADQPAVTEVGTEGAAWSEKVGDTTYSDTKIMAEAFRKMHGAYTQRSQDFSRLKSESEASRELVQFIKSDPALVAEVRKRIDAGASPADAARQTAKAHEQDPRIDQMWDRMGEMEQEGASQRFMSEHADLTEEELGGIEKWLEENSEWLDRSKLSYERQLGIAFNELFRNKMAPKLVLEGQKIAEDAIRKGKKAESLGTAAASAQAGASKKPYKEMTGAERRAYAQQVWERSAAKR